MRTKLRLAWATISIIAALLAPAFDSATGQVQIDVNRPRTAFDCDIPVGEKWYGSTERCLEELCAGQNVFNEYIFDEHNRRRRNPCNGRSPTEYEAR